jgi:rhodanese-related sulfurtransferase
LDSGKPFPVESGFEMTRKWRDALWQALVLIVLGGGVGLVNNGLKEPSRRLAWVTDYPDKNAGGVVAADSVHDLTAATAPGEALADGLEEKAAVTSDWRRAELPPIDADAVAVEIEPLQARRLWEEGAAFVDARRSRQYEEGHIRGACSIPTFETALLDERLDQLAFEVQPEEPIVVYCSGGDCQDSHMLAERLWTEGFINVLIYRDGYPDWLRMGGAVEEGSGK